MSIAAADWVGTTLAGGRYRITAKLGEGGMGVVYRAWDENVGHDVVVKVPRRSMMDDPGFAARFKDEIRSLIRLPHPHIVKVFDVGEHDGLPFAVMQYLPGGSLEDRVYGRDGKPQPMPPSSLTSWLPHVAKALQFMHAEQFIHRDVKPANILFDAQGNAYLSDFGVHKALAGGEAAARTKAHTGTGLVLGTPHYMAPELAKGDAIDGRIDQYALAVTVHEVLSGQKPFDGPNGMAILFQQAQQAPPPLDSVAPGIPRALAEAVLRALDKTPDKRFKSCTAFAGAVLSSAGGAAGQPRAAGGTAALAPIPVSSGKTAPAPLPVSSPMKTTQQALRPAVSTAAMAPAADAGQAAPSVPAPVAVNAGTTSIIAHSAAGKPQQRAALKWLKSPVGISLSAAGGLLVVALLAIVLSSGGPKPHRIVKPDPPKPGDKQLPQVVEDPLAESKLRQSISDWNRLATELERDLPSISSLLDRMEYESQDDLHTLADQADDRRTEMADDPRVGELRKTKTKIEEILAKLQKAPKSRRAEGAIEAMAADADAINKRLSEIDDRLKTPISQSTQIKTELDTLGELDRVQKTWRAAAMSQSTRSRALQYAGQKGNRAMQFLGTCALLRNGSLDAELHRDLLRDWDLTYTIEQRSDLCQALITSGNRDLLEEAMQQINKEPQLLDMYDPEELIAEIEQHRPRWQEARDALASHFAGPTAERIASALGPAAGVSGAEKQTNAPPGRSRPAASADSGPSVFKPAMSARWDSPILLPGGSSLVADAVNLSGFQLAKIEKEMPTTAFAFKNEKSPKGGLLVHSAWSAKKQQTLSLDGWTIFRHENGSPKFAVQFVDGDRKGPLRLWDADNKLRLYANYIKDELHGPACYFENGNPAIVMEFERDRLKAKYLVDYQSGNPVARAVEDLPPDLAQTFAASEKQFQVLSDDITEQELKLKHWLRDTYNEVQKKMKTERAKYLRAKNKANEKRARAEYEAGVARAVTAAAIGTGAGF